MDVIQVDLLAFLKAVCKDLFPVNALKDLSGTIAAYPWLVVRGMRLRPGFDRLAFERLDGQEFRVRSVHLEHFQLGHRLAVLLDVLEAGPRWLLQLKGPAKLTMTFRRLELRPSLSRAFSDTKLSLERLLLEHVGPYHPAVVHADFGGVDRFVPSSAHVL